MFDMHSHILPGVDDGAEFFDEAREMVDIAVQNGTEALVLTPHYILRHNGPSLSAEELRERFDIFAQKVHRVYPALSLYFGAENFLSEHMMQRFSRGQLIPLENTSYVLVEFDFHEQPYIAEYAVDQLLNADYRPIIAHPERYRFLQQDDDLVERLVQKGCLFQMNAGSQAGLYGPEAQRLSRWMLRQEYIHCVGSDAHSPYQRTPDMSETYAYVSEQISPEYSDKIFKSNPRDILNSTAVTAEGEEDL